MPAFADGLPAIPGWPGPVDDEDDEDSDDSTDKDTTLVSGKRLGAAGDWLVQQAPVFLCGLAVAWVTLLVLWRSDDAVLRAEVERARVLLAEMRHMSDVLRVEVGEARQLVAAGVLAGKAGSAGNAMPHTSGEAEQQWSSSVLVLPPNLSSGWPDSISASEGQGLPSLALQVLWPIALFFLDAGLVYFCLRQFTSHAAKVQLETLLQRFLSQPGLGSCLAELTGKPASPTSSKPVVTAAEVAAGTGRAASPLAARVEPSAADAFLVRRRNGDELAPVQRLQAQRQAEQFSACRRRCLTIALGATSLALVAAMRLMGRAAALVGWRFLNHLVMYAVLTVRVCLIVFLVLF